jgi:hypothetical protein
MKARNVMTVAMTVASRLHYKNHHRRAGSSYLRSAQVRLLPFLPAAALLAASWI